MYTKQNNPEAMEVYTHGPYIKTTDVSPFIKRKMHYSYKRLDSAKPIPPIHNNCEIA